MLACIASYGSLSAALAAGDSTPVTGGAEPISARDPATGKRRDHAKLATYL